MENLDVMFLTGNKCTLIFLFVLYFFTFVDSTLSNRFFPDRMSTFLDSLWRSFSINESQNYVLVTHGISIRVLLARYFRYSVDQFNLMVSTTGMVMLEVTALLN